MAREVKRATWSKPYDGFTSGFVACTSMTSTWNGTLPESPPTTQSDEWHVPPTGAPFRDAPTPPPPPPTPSSPPPHRRGGGWRAATAVFAALALVGGGYMVRDLTDSDRSAVATSASQLDTSPSTSLPSGTTPEVSTTGDEPVADVAAAVGPAVVQIQVSNGRESGLGSGTIYDAEGYILTNAHVVGQSETVRVILADGTSFQGEVLGTYEAVDIAVVDIDADIDLPVARLATDDVRVGQTAVALGSPFGLDQTVTAGIISALDRAVPSDQGGAVNMIQTDAPINPGNSGGALANRHGEIIGVPSQIFSQSGENNGIGFAIPIETAKRIADKIVNGEPLARAGLGVVVAQEQSNEPGAVIETVTAGGGADVAGLEPGDRITAIDGDTVRDTAELMGTLGTYGAGDTVTVTIVRSESTLEVEVTLGPI